jgi:UDP:flavonoid glycosyltransferase YjiC (YdhE family)
VRVLFCSLASNGFLFPMIGIARELVLRGHSVAFAADSSTANALEKEGLPRIPRGVNDGRSFQNELWGEPDAIAIQVKHIEWALKIFHPDVLLGQHLTLGPLIVRDCCRIPTVLLGSLAYLWPSFSGSSSDTLDHWRRWRYGNVMEKYNDARAVFGLRRRDHSGPDARFDGDLFLLRSIPELIQGQTLPSTVRFAGHCLWEPETPDEEISTWITEQNKKRKPILYIQQGRVFGGATFWESLLSVADGAGFAIAGPMPSPIPTCDLVNIPHSAYIRKHVPQSKLLPHAAAVVATGNATAVLGACAAGIPALLVPVGGEQVDIASLCERAGIARTCYSDQVDCDSLKTQVHSLLQNSPLRRNAAVIADAFKHIDSYGVIAETLATATGKPC